MEDNLKDLKQEYKNTLASATSKDEQKAIKSDYKEMKHIFKEVNKITKKNNLNESSDEFWSKFDFPSFDDYKESNLESDNSINEITENIEKSKQQYEQQKKHSDEVMKKANDIIKQIDEKLAKLESENTLRNENEK